jgi:hypothetical protein
LAASILPFGPKYTVLDTGVFWRGGLFENLLPQQAVLNRSRLMSPAQSSVLVDTASLVTLDPKFQNEFESRLLEFSATVSELS